MDESVKSTGRLMHELGDGAILSNPPSRTLVPPEYAYTCKHALMSKHSHSCVIQFIIRVFSFHLFSNCFVFRTSSQLLH